MCVGNLLTGPACKITLVCILQNSDLSRSQTWPVRRTPMETGNFQGEVTALRAYSRNSTAIVIYIWCRSYYYLRPSLRVWPHVPWEDMSIVLKCKFPSKIHYQLSWGHSCSIHYPGNTWEVIKNLPCDGPCCMVGYVHPNSLIVSAAFCVSHKSTTYVILLIVCALICTSYHYTGSL